MTTKPKATLLDEISSLCDDKSSFRARGILHTFHETASSPFLDKILMLLEYIQLISPLLLVAVSLNFTQYTALFQAVLFTARLINPSYWMSFDKTGALENAILIIVCFFTLIKLFLLFYIVYVCKKAEEPNSSIGAFWRGCIKFQSRITYFYVTSFYFAAMRVTNWETFEIKESQTEGIKIVLFIFIGIETVLAIIPKIRFHNILPTKSFLSAKENTVEVATLVQKIVFQILTHYLNFSFQSSFWICISINLCFDAFRLTNFFVRLPLYSFKALLFKGCLLVTIASFNISCVVALIVKSIDETKSSLAFILILWAILLALGINLSNNFLKGAFWRLVCDPSLKTPHLLVHRIVAIKELQGLKQGQSDRYDFYFLMNQTLNFHIEKILWSANPDLTSMNLLFKNYLEKLQEKFPKNQYLQLYLAEFLFKKIKIMSDPIRICLNLRKNGYSKMRPNAELLLIRIQNHIKTSFNQNLDINSFLAQQAFVAKLKQEMQKQTDLQIKICFEITKDNPNLEHIYSNSQKAKIYRENTIKGIKRMSMTLNDFNTEPLLIAAKYHLSVNHSLQNYLFFTKLYTQKHLKYQKYFSQANLCQENIFQDNMGFLVMTGVKGKEGNVLYCTKQAENILGGDMRDYIGVSFVERTPPIFRSLYSLVWKTVPEDPESTYMGKFNRCLLYHVNGYLIEVDYFIHVHPFASQGFKFIFIMRPVVSEREFILLHENGKIDSASKGLIEKLGLKPHGKRTNIKALNEELIRINEAFNMMAFPQKYENKSLNKAEAEEIHWKYTTEGMNLLLKSIDGGTSYSYHCKVESLVFGSSIIKTLTLEENKRENKERTHDIISPTTAAQKQKESDNSSFETEEEKEEGWIDFDILMVSRKYPSESIQSPSQIQTLRTQREDTQRHLLTNQFQNASPLKKATEFQKHFSDSTDERPEAEDHYYRAKIPQSSKNSGKLSQQQKRISSVFQASLDARYYSKAFKGLLGLFYATLAALIITRVAVRVATNHDMDSLVAKKDIFNNNSWRSYYLIETSGLTRYVWQFYSGVLEISDYGPEYAVDFNLSRSFIYQNIMNLRDFNRAILKASSILDKEADDILYSNNVKIYNTYFDEPAQSFTIMDSFQAVDQIVEAALYVYYGIMEQPAATQEMTNRAKFLFRNALNDLIAKSAQITFAMVDSFNDQFQQVKKTSISFSIVFALLLGAFSIVFCVFLIRQYSWDIFYISAVCRLNHTRIQAIHKELISFQKYLQDQDNDNTPNALKKSQYIKNNAKSVQDLSLNNHVKTVQIPETKDLLKRSMFDMTGIIIVVFLPIILTIYDQVAGNHILQKIKSNQEKLSFINMIRVTTGMASTSFRELAATNNTVFVENMPVLNKLQVATAQLAALRVRMYSEIMTDDILEEYPELETLLLGDGCLLLNSTFGHYCGILKQKGKSRGLISLMNDFEGYLKGKIQDYQDSNKTLEALMELQMENYDIISVVYAISFYEIDYIWVKVNEQFDRNIEKDSGRRINSLIGVLITIIIAGIIGWKYMLKGIGESVSRFKNILRVFPAELVLSSFILKNFLMKTSNGALDQIKNEI